MKYIKWFTIVLIAIIIVSIIMLIIANTFSKFEGSVEGTGFVKQEFFGAGGYHYDADDYGNIYFAILTKGVVIYDDLGEYKYTLKKPSSGALSIKIDTQNNILIYDVRENIIYHYNNKGFLIYTEDNIDPVIRNEMVRPIVKVTRDNIEYIRKNHTIIKEENGVETVVFKVPIWQRWYRAFKLILIFSSLALFLRLGIKAWLKTYY